MRSPSETETVVKRILPYLRRRGYDDSRDFEYEVGATYEERYSKGYVDILVTCGLAQPLFLVEAKRLARALTKADERQALAYGRAKKVPFVVVTNGREVRCLNTLTGDPIRWDGSIAGRVPTRDQVRRAAEHLRRSPDAQEVPLSGDASLPFRPGLPLRQLNHVFAQCHSWIRNIEKREDDSFADFSKILFLKLLEEKADADGTRLPYSYRFWELAEVSDSRADQVKASIQAMIHEARKEYGDVLADPLKLNQASTYLRIVRALAAVSFIDSEADVKGAAFEYFVRATLKGKKLGQYFTPRPLVDFMVALLGRDRVVNSLKAGVPVRVVDPACGTGGFLVYMMRDALAAIDADFRANRITAEARNHLIRQIKREVFYGSDANDGVASAAKMNMIIAGDGHANISAEDTLTRGARAWRPDGGIDLVITNPPFGTSEADSLDSEDRGAYDIDTSRGQLLFLQRMLKEVKPEGLICTVIDEGVLNTESASPIRRAILETTHVRAVVRLPPETFRPNKINVRAAVIFMQRRAAADPDLQERYPVRFVDLQSLGYDGMGMTVRGFDFARLKREVAAWTALDRPTKRAGYGWSGFTVPSLAIGDDRTYRLDYKYWVPEVRKRLSSARRKDAVTIRELNLVPTSRGKSPRSELYVDQTDGYARVLKAGSSITQYGEVAAVTPETDFLEKDEYDRLPDACKVQRGDVLLSSTGTGTLGKAAVYESDEPAVADGHVTIIRVNSRSVDPRYLADYLRTGFGRVQIERLYTGSTGLIELTPQQVDAIVVELPEKARQRAASAKLRRGERAARASTERGAKQLGDVRGAFLAQA